ncbi:predicted protein [Uncinocarpus reesii 1704]|uniref:PH-response regulator protein palH/RIM21 n=1 Tax=Uncinocarpus reesii (strain UAMH 1704) TaxID=336963 RepID=C4JUY0_UNCRE|nr:uncharacterized protein UREG_04933 [Uncinocarpus reesii 1704]EEP80091.1 predicted protein [Uncinocarpus reesii 1704]
MPGLFMDYGHHLHKNRTRGCLPIALVKGGKITFNDTYSLTLPQNAIFEPLCRDYPNARPVDPSTVINMHEPFYASTFPQMYAVAAATVISYLLLIMLFITPRTFFIGGRGGGFLSRHGMISGSYGSSSVIGVGGRPWLQKVAALTVVISLTIATADSFAVAKRQYDMGFMDSMALTDEVVSGVEIRTIRVISSTFLWLAQVQTLIRLFPRHKEKVIIKWVGFAMIMLDTIFSILNNTIRQATTMLVQPRQIVDAIPALNYLFELALSLLYAAWVIFYSLSKHRFAFFHVNMRNICLVALLSLVAVLIPVVFFILDVSKPDVAGWGEYIRWVGAAAASVVVWEWVERIEALEREERKDGILGREIFDGDEMLETTPSEEVDSPHDRHGGGTGGKKGVGGSIWTKMMGLTPRPLRSRVRYQHRSHPRRKRQQRAKTEDTPESVESEHPTPPPQAITPVSRADTASTVYRVRHHSIGSLSPSMPDMMANEEAEKGFELVRTRDSDPRSGHAISSPIPSIRHGIDWLHTLNPFRRRRGSPPQEVASAQAEEGNIRHPTPAGSKDEAQAGSTLKGHIGSSWRSFLHRDWGARDEDVQRRESVLPVTVIPARSRRERTASHGAVHRSGSQQSRDGSNDRGATGTPLPVVVIPARPRIAKAWDSSAFEEYVRNQPNNLSPALQNDHNSTSLGVQQPQTTPSEQQDVNPLNQLSSDYEADTGGAQRSIESTTRFPSSRSSSGRTLTGSAPLTLDDTGQRISVPERRSPSTQHRRVWDDSGGTDGVT